VGKGPVICNRIVGHDGLDSFARTMGNVSGVLISILHTVQAVSVTNKLYCASRTGFRIRECFGKLTMSLSPHKYVLQLVLTTYPHLQTRWRMCGYLMSTPLIHLRGIVQVHYITKSRSCMKTYKG